MEPKKMKEFYHQLLHKAACGHLVQGLIHNMSGPLQILSMQVEIMKSICSRNFQERDGDKEKHQKRIEQIEEQILRLRHLLNTISQITEETATNLDLNELLKDLLLFWEGDLRFKHEVKKVFEPSSGPLFLFAPPKFIAEGLCAVFWWLVPHLVETNSSLRIVTEKTEAGPKVVLFLEQGLPEKNQFWELAQELLSPYAEIREETQALEIQFKNN